jgi:hypothetical protein
LDVNHLTQQTANWLRSVLQTLPARIHAIYVEYGDAFTPEMVHLICFNAFGFESLASGSFDPINRDHVDELGEFTWEPSDNCSFQASDYPSINGMVVLRNAAELPEIKRLAQEQGIQFIVGEHDGAVFVVT